MTVQWLDHKCHEVKRNPSVAISNTKVDGKTTGWQMHLRASDREARFECATYIEYCPFCGEKLDGDVVR